MIAFASPVTKPGVYARCAEPGIGRCAEPDSEVVAEPAQGSISRSYNALLDRFAGRDDLEALVLLHQDTEIVDTDFCRRARRGAQRSGRRSCRLRGGDRRASIAWWEGSVTLSSFANRYEEYGGGELPGFSWDPDDSPPYAQVGEVDTLDGFLLVLSPWTVRNIRFDEDLSEFHGYDLDFCLQVREAGRKVITADIRAIHHRPIEMLPDMEPWVEAHIRVAEKWDGRIPGIGTAPGSWEERARRAEAERDAARTLAHTKKLELQARRLQVERALEEARGSISWRVTAPLRLLARR